MIAAAPVQLALAPRPGGRPRSRARAPAPRRRWPWRRSPTSSPSRVVRGRSSPPTPTRARPSPAPTSALARLAAAPAGDRRRPPAPRPAGDRGHHRHRHRLRHDDPPHRARGRRRAGRRSTTPPSPTSCAGSRRSRTTTACASSAIEMDRRPDPGIVSATMTLQGDADGPRSQTSGAPALPYGFARRHGVILRRDRDRPGLRPPLRARRCTALIEVQRLAGPGLSFEPLGDAAFDAALAQAYRDTASDASEAAAADDDLAALADSAAMVDDLLDQSDDAPVVRLINALLLEAIKENASDIHIETQERRLVVRFRVDGILREVLEPRRGARAAARQPHQGDGQARHRREAPAAGRPGLAAGRRPRGRRARLDHPVAVRRAGGDAPARPRRRAARPRPARHEPRATAPPSSGCSRAPTASCSSPGRPARARPPRSMPRSARSTTAAATS